MSKQFADIAHISVQSGSGGAGAVSFRREKFVPRGGPDGGNGGKGGDVIILASKTEKTLRNLRYTQTMIADSGENGSKSNRHGKNGKDLILRVPVGTVIKDEQGTIIADLSNADASLTLIRGGRGGRGNANFKSATLQAPKFAQSGEESKKLDLIIELELIADYGFVGAPNVGKSTLLKALTKADPKIGNYPFTTLIPNLGTLNNFQKEIILADIPGLISGAAQGLGLGLQFLKHIKKTRGLIFVLDAALDDEITLGSYQDLRNANQAPDTKIQNYNINETNKDVLELITRTVEHLFFQFKMLEKELACFDRTLVKKARIIVLSRVDMSYLSTEYFKEISTNFGTLLGNDKKTNDTYRIIPISSFSALGLEELKNELFDTIEQIS